MKKIFLKSAKKSLALFMACLMLMSAWVFMPGEHQIKAEAANYSGYTITVNFTVSDANNEGTSKCDITFADGSTSTWNLDKTESDEGTYDISSSAFAKWPKKLVFEVDQGGIRTQNIKINNIRINGKTILAGGWTMNPGHWGNQKKTFESNGSVSSGGDTGSPSTNWWPTPAVTTVDANPKPETISVPASGTASKTFTATYMDQYGVAIAGSGATAALDSEIKGTTVTISGNTATVAASLEAIDTFIANGKYSTSTGKAEAELTITNNGVAASCTVTFEAPKFPVYWKNWNGTTLETDSNQIYMSTPTYNGTTPTRASDGDNKYTFSGWSPAVGQVTGDTTYTATFDATAHTWPAEYKEENTIPATCTTEGSYERAYYCTVCGYELNRTYHVNEKMAHTFTIENAEDRYKISDATCNARAKYYKSCKDCGASSESNLYTFEYGDFDFSTHKISKVEGRPSTCYSEGIKDYYECSVCHRKFSDASGNTEVSDDDLVIEIIPHTAEEIPAIAPSCYSVGYTEGTKCSVCGTMIVEPEEIPMLTHIDKNKDHYCDHGCGEYFDFCEDNDYDHYCDYGCGEYYGDHEDTDKDHFCDYGCDDKIGDHKDENKDHNCDYGCEVSFGECIDADKDHKCDYGCDLYYGKHEDKDKDHNCDYGCKETIGDHEDANKDHNCDYGCEDTIGECVDADKDHDCDYGCDKYYGEHEDENKDHNCDYGCKETIGEHADPEGDGDHDCDYCGDKMNECTKGEAVEENRVAATCEKDGSYDVVYYCTECGEEVERETEIIPKLNHAWTVSYSWSEDGKACTATRICSNDENHVETAEATITSRIIRTPACGVRGITEYTATFVVDWAATQVIELDDIDAACPDTNKDHWCDDNPRVEGHYVGVHEDKNPIDHVCDYGCSDPIGECKDDDKDHNCDHGCGKKFGDCGDADKDHKCDYGCDKFYGIHADMENDGNHECEYCGKVMGECTKGEENIENKTEPTCDKEGSYESVHYCTECGKEVSRVKKTIEKLPHDWNETVYSWDADAKTFTATRTCKNFASHVESETVAAIEEILVAPKCEEEASPEGRARYTSAFTVDWATEQTKEIVLSALPHKDDDLDHKCDSGCNITFGVCEDVNKDHKCDYGCDKFFGKHEDLTGPNDRPDHFCDYCNGRISDCVDEDLDHNCDFNCGESYGTCEDKNHDHNCDYGVNCDKYFGEHKDENKDHECDYGCQNRFGEHKWTGHSENDSIKTAATCMSPAIYYNHCAYCKQPVEGATHEYGEVDTVNGHKFNGKVTATENDNHSVKCTVEGCSESKLVDCSYETTKEVAATCKTNGYKVEKCLICKASKKTNTDKNPNNHVGETEVKNAVAATCSKNGYTGDTYCLDCNTKIADGTDIIANPNIHAHVNMKDYAKVDSTCEAEGHEAYRYCDACDTYAVAKVVIAKKDHKYTEYVSNGNGTHSAKCETCSATQNTIGCSGGTATCVDKKICEFCEAEYGEVDSSNHNNKVRVAKKSATCQEEGYYSYLKCEDCDTALETIVTIEKADHSYGQWTKVAGEDKHEKICVTCDEKVGTVASVKEDCSGGYAYCNKLAKCDTCRAEYGSFNSANHRSEVTTIVGAKEATCYEEGFSGNAYYICCYDADKTEAENASALAKAGVATEMAAHSYTIEIVSERVPANCKETGEATYKCSTCPEGKEVTQIRTLEIDLNNHKSTSTKTIGEQAATCIEDGFSGNVYYDCCYDETKTEAENRIALKTKGTVIKANGEHTYGDIYPEYQISEIREVKDENNNVISREIVVKAEMPTYEEMVAARRADGFWYHIKLCEVCNEVNETRCYSYTSDKATCTTTEICEVCEGLCSLKNEKKHADATLVAGTPATCTENGKRDSYKCNDCGKLFFDEACKNEITKENEKDLIILANGAHTIDRKNQKPASNGDGSHTYKCSVCSVADITENCSGGTATCLTLKKCQYCNTSYGELNDRNHEKGTVETGRVDPDRCKPGVKGKVEYECCGKVVSGGEEIPALEDHTWTETTSKTDNCASGYTITKTCDVCGSIETEDVAAGAHELSVIVYESEKDCTKDRYIYYACSICSYTDKEVVIDGTTYKYISVEEIPARDDCSWSAWNTVKATCIAEGSKSRYCMVCGKTENIVLPKVEHTILIEGGYAATCETAGKQDYAYCVVPGCPYAKGGQPIGTVPGYEKYADSNGLVINALGHGDHNGDDYCDGCGRFEGSNIDGTNCNCICHKQNGFMKLIYKFLQFFWKLFKINKTCCSAGVHY